MLEHAASVFSAYDVLDVFLIAESLFQHHITPFLRDIPFRNILLDGMIILSRTTMYFQHFYWKLATLLDRSVVLSR